MVLQFNPAWEPTLEGYAEDKTPNVRRAQFEGGYSQRSKTGPNSVGREVSLSWEVEQAQKDYIDGFLSDRGGAEAFHYQLPWDVEATLWTCEAWGSVPIGTSRGATMWRIRATFRQEFDIV